MNEPDTADPDARMLAELALRRFDARQTPVLPDLIAELVRARQKFPGNRFMFAALVEEVGELAEAIVKGDAKQIRDEAIQVAATAIRIAEEGDATKYRSDGFAQLVSAVGLVARSFLQKNNTVLGIVLRNIGGIASYIHSDGDPTFDDITPEESQP